MSDFDDIDFDRIMQDDVSVIDNDSSQFKRQLHSLLSQDTSGGMSGMSVDDESDGQEEMKIPDECHPQIKNVVGSVNTRCSLPLKMITNRVRNTEYNPKRFSAMTMRIRNPKATANIFATGKIIVTGAKDEETCRKAAYKFVKIIKKAGVGNAGFHDFKIHNIVAHCSLGFPVKLEGLAAKYDSSCLYQPELFPGVVWKFSKPKANAIIFVSGEITFTGAESREDIYRCFERLYPKLLAFMKGSHKERVINWIQNAQTKPKPDGMLIKGGSEDQPIEID